MFESDKVMSLHDYVHHIYETIKKYKLDQRYFGEIISQEESVREILSDYKAGLQSNKFLLDIATRVEKKIIEEIELIKKKDAMLKQQQKVSLYSLIKE